MGTLKKQEGGYEQAILDGEVLTSGAIVDQVKGVILLSNGLKIEGKTGDILDTQGKVIKELEKS